LEFNENLRIAIAAPTGKAANKLYNSIKVGIGQDKEDRIPKEASTIHRLLGTKSKSIRYRHNRRNPLPYDLIIVDEASMIDLPLISSLVDAVRDDAKLIFIGDRYQLSSVDVGAVFGDICCRNRKREYTEKFATIIREVLNVDIPISQNILPLDDSVIELVKNYRTESLEIVNLASAVKEGKITETREILGRGSIVKKMELPPKSGFKKRLKEVVLREIAPIFEKKDVREKFELFNKFRILSPTRHDYYGVESINRKIEKILRENGSIGHASLYSGCPIMIRENDYYLKLFNGDLAIVEFEDGRGMANFVYDDGSIRRIPVTRLPRYEKVYAITVHQSQGSEFDKVLLIMRDEPAPIFTRELLYTAITRAKKEIELWVEDSILEYTFSHVIERESGIEWELWEKGRGQ
jgi:exodeoxyribonuclease V alpha subunit